MLLRREGEGRDTSGLLLHGHYWEDTTQAVVPSSTLRGKAAHAHTTHEQGRTIAFGLGGNMQIKALSQPKVAVS